MSVEVRWRPQRSEQEAVARQFLAFLGSPEGRTILRKGGLFPPGR
ncbi:MAG: hypothetical protein ABI693_31930 [Bryobacteraceae bacterium]